VTESNTELATTYKWLRWRCKPLGVDVECTKVILDIFRSQAGNEGLPLARSGSERRGILFGKWTKRSIRIVAARPIDYEGTSGSSLPFSNEDEASVLHAILLARQDPELRSLDPIGLYMSSQNFSMAVADVRIFDRYYDRSFPKARHMAVVLRPWKFSQVRVGFFVKERTGIRYFCAQEVSSPTSGSPQREQATVSENSQSEDRLVEQAVPLVESGLTTGPSPEAFVSSKEALGRRLVNKLQRFRSPAPVRQKWWQVSRRELAAAIVLLVFCAGATRALWVRSSFVHTSRNPMRISNIGPQLRIDWDPTVEPVLSATSGVLEIRDGESEPVLLRITRDGLHAGSVFYARRSGNVEMQLKLMDAKGAHHDSITYYINPAGAPPADSTLALSPATSKPELPAIAEPLPVTQALNEQSSTAGDQVQQPREANRSTRKRTQSANRGRKPRVFHLPPIRTSSLTDVGMHPDFLEAPDIRVSQPVPQTILASAATVARSAVEARSNWGRLIWTGELPKNEFVLFSTNGSSRGVLNGRLPGFPVKIHVQPGEVLDGGIAILTNDTKLLGMNEPPHARNGWDLVIYKRAQKPLPELRVVEPPGPSNSWSRMILQNGDRNLSVVIVDWQAMDAPRPGD
jgi:hypothetical protein